MGTILILDLSARIKSIQRNIIASRTAMTANKYSLLIMDKKNINR
jgi:hypothetical protein